MAVLFMFAEIDFRLRSRRSICQEAGLSHAYLETIASKGRSPTIDNVEAVLNVLGYRLAVVPK